MPFTPRMMPTILIPQLQQTASATQALGLRWSPRLKAAVTKLFVFAVLSGSLVYQAGCQKTPEPQIPQGPDRQSENPAEYPSLVGEVLPGFTTTESGYMGIGLIANHFGRDKVLRTHPISQDKPCVLSTKTNVAAGKKTKLLLDVSHDSYGDWRLVVRGNGQTLAEEMISKETCPNGWRTITVDLSQFAGQELELELIDQANDWNNEFGYWGGAKIVTED